METTAKQQEELKTQKRGREYESDIIVWKGVSSSFLFSRCRARHQTIDVEQHGGRLWTTDIASWWLELKKMWEGSRSNAWDHEQHGQAKIAN